MSFDENVFDVSLRYSLDWFSSFVVVIMVAAVYGVSEVIVTSYISISFLVKTCLFLILELWYPMRGAVCLVLKSYYPFIHFVFPSTSAVVVVVVVQIVDKIFPKTAPAG